jgi:hypothetical protein
MQIIRRPHAVRQHFGRKRAANADDYEEEELRATSLARAWKEGKHLQARKQELQKHIKSVRHHEVAHDRSHGASLRALPAHGCFAALHVKLVSYPLPQTW